MYPVVLFLIALGAAIAQLVVSKTKATFPETVKVLLERGADPSGRVERLPLKNRLLNCGLEKIMEWTEGEEKDLESVALGIALELVNLGGLKDCAENEGGMTALDLARKAGRSETANLLEEPGREAGGTRGRIPGRGSR